MINFNEMNITNEIKRALTDMGFESATPIQEEVIPFMLDHKDIIAQAPTGTGKTCAFGIPVINNIDLDIEETQALILCPTRELVIQTQNELKEVAKYSKDVKIVSIYGGQNFDRQLAGLRKKPQIIIGTTGRVMDHLRRKTIKLGSIKVLILDEVDEMLDMGFREDIDIILESVPKERQTVLFSATVPKEIVEISKLYQKEPVSIKTQFEESDLPNINQYYVTVSENDKISALVSIIQNKKYKLVLVFCNTKKRVDELNAHINSLGIATDALHGDLRQHNRDKTMKRFRSGEIQMLIATDVAARGIDVDNIDAVFNFDIPHDEEYYVHRIGRTARASKTGDAYTFVSDKQLYIINNFERYTKNTIIKAGLFADTLEKNIDKKLFEKTLKLVKKGDLTSYKEFLSIELSKFTEKYQDAEILDIAAALLLQLNEGAVKNITLSQPPSVTMKDKAPKNKKLDGVKFFMNIGTRDKCDSSSIAKFITIKTGIPASSILGINCLENYSFANVTEGNNDAMEALNGMMFNKRILAVEIATASDKNKKDYTQSQNKKSDFSNKRDKNNYSNKKDSKNKSDYSNKKEFWDNSNKNESKNKSEQKSRSKKLSLKNKDIKGK